YKVAPTGERWGASEITEQIRLTRDEPGVSGNVRFNESSITRAWDGLPARLAAGPYALPSLPPATPWLSAGVPVPPSASRDDVPAGVRLRVTPAAASGTAVARWWLVEARYPDG